MLSSAALLSLGIDACFGEPPAHLHPVVGMGSYLGLKDRLLRVSSRPYPRFVLGVGFVLLGAFVCGGAAWGLTRVLKGSSWPARTLLTAVMLKPMFSVAALLDAGKTVQEALEHHELEGARRLLTWHLVSRDTTALSEAEVAGAAVASLAENLTDSIVAPLFYFALLGLPGAAVYRFVNTADAVLGYRTPELEFFGKFAARTDDALNFVPARLTALLLTAALKLSGASARSSWRGMLRDHSRTPSPNGGVTMALTAAGLGVRLEKRGVYVLNEVGRDATGSDIGRARRLVKLTTALGLGLYLYLEQGVPEPVLTLPPYTLHGGPDGSVRTLLDFSVNSNPFGPPPELLTHLQAVDVVSYPDPTYTVARAAAAAFHGVTLENIVLGGAAELIYRLSACYLNSGRKVLVASPTFGEYGRSAALVGAQVECCDVYTNIDPDLEKFVCAVRKVRPTLVWLCGPNNPTGHAWSPSALAEVAAVCARQDAMLVIDAAYLELSEIELSDADPSLPEGAVRLFPLTKTFGVAGLRAGYALAPPRVAETLRRAAPPWPVSSPAAAAVNWCRSPAGTAFVRRSVPEVLELRRALQIGLRKLGFEVWNGRSSFFLVEVGDAPAFTARAKMAGFRVRDGSSFGLPHCVRLAAQGREANEKLLRWLAC